MGGFVSVYPLVPGSNPDIGPDFDATAVAEFVARWSLDPVAGSDGDFLAPIDQYGNRSEVTAGPRCFDVQRPTPTDMDMAFDWMLTIGGTAVGDFDMFISRDTGWLDVPSPEMGSHLVYVVDDIAAARSAYFGTDRTPPGIWDVRRGFDGVPVIVPRPMRGYSPEVRWNGWLVMIHEDEIEVQVVPDHGFWGVPLREVEPNRVYLAGGWTIRDVDGVLKLNRDGAAFTVESTGEGPRVTRV